MKYYTDGFNIKKNPSDIGGGFTVSDEEGNIISRETIYKSKFTNNEAELLGVFNCAKSSCVPYDTISTDSKNTLAWLKTPRMNKIARQDLMEIIIECKKIIKEKNIELIWEPREFNLAGIYNETNPVKE